MDNLKEEDKYKLLMDENNEGMRYVSVISLKFAMNLSATGIFQGMSMCLLFHLTV